MRLLHISEEENIVKFERYRLDFAGVQQNEP